MGWLEGVFVFARKPEEMLVGIFGDISTCCFYLLMRPHDATPFTEEQGVNPSSLAKPPWELAGTFSSPESEELHSSCSLSTGHFLLPDEACLC